MVVSEKFRLELLKLRARGVRQHEIARRAKLTPSLLSGICSGIYPVKDRDVRVLRTKCVINRLAGADVLTDADCFEPDPIDVDEEPAAAADVADETDAGRRLLTWDPRRRQG